jgi:hypothetical protein
MSKIFSLPTKPRLNGYSDAQVETIMEHIATTANVLRKFAHNKNCNPEDASEDDHYIAAMLAERIGLLADMAIGGACVGGPAEWLLGPNFADNGASHG